MNKIFIALGLMISANTFAISTQDLAEAQKKMETNVSAYIVFPSALFDPTDRGLYIVEENRILLNKYLLKSILLITLSHEVGHNRWVYGMSTAERSKWCIEFKENPIIIPRSKTSNGNIDCAENFADSYMMRNVESWSFLDLSHDWRFNLIDNLK